MQALESLNDTQVNDFLSGKTPLNLSMRLGDHMMLIQLQLSTVNPSNSSSSSAASSSGASTSAGSSRSRSIFRSKTTSAARSMAHLQPYPSTSTNSNSSSSTNSTPIKFNNTTNTTHNMYKSLSANQLNEKYRSNGLGDDVGGGGGGECSTRGSSALLQLNHDFNELRRMMRELDEQEAAEKKARNRTVNLNRPSAMGTELLETSPIKSLSNLVSAPIKMPPLKSTTLDLPSTSSASSVCKCAGTSTECDASDCRLRPSTSADALKTTSRSSAFLHRTMNNAIAKARSSPRIALHPQTNAAAHLLNVRRTKGTEVHSDQPSTSATTTTATDMAVEQEPLASGSPIDMLGSPETLAEASRNLTKTLRKLSKEVFSGKSESVALVRSDDKRRASEQSGSKSSSSSSDQSRSGSQKSGSGSSGFGSGAVIESMRNHGIYSGTFSGTLNPALQDRYGRPKRDISTVIHILNDLLSATPHYSRGARISFEPAPPRKHVSTPIHAFIVNIQIKQQTTNFSQPKLLLSIISVIVIETFQHIQLKSIIATAWPMYQMCPRVRKIIRMCSRLSAQPSQ